MLSSSLAACWKQVGSCVAVASFALVTGCTRTIPVEEIQVQGVRAPHLATVRMAVVAPPEMVPDATETSDVLASYRLEGLRRRLQEALTASLGLSLAKLDFLDAAPTTGYDILLWLRLDARIEISAAGFSNYAKVELELEATDLAGRRIATSAGRSNQEPYYLEKAFHEAIDPAISDIATALDQHFAAILAAGGSEMPTSMGNTVEIEILGLEEIVQRNSTHSYFERISAGAEDDFCDQVAAAFEIPWGTIARWDASVGFSSAGSLRLRIVLVAAGDEYQISAVAIPVDPSTNGETMVLADEYVPREVSILSSTSQGATTRVLARLYVIDEAEYPAGARRFAYERKIRNRETREAIDEMLAEFVRNLMRDEILAPPAAQGR